MNHPSPRAECQYCPVRPCVLICGNPASRRHAAEVVHPTAVVPGENALFRAGDVQDSLYVVRGGCIKDATVDLEGNERIRGFHFSGEFIGLDALGGGTHLSTATSVTPSQVCAMPIASLWALTAEMPEVATHVLRQISHELALSLAMSGEYTAAQRIAAFLLNVRDRTHATHVVRLPMVQRDIGNYLRLANETVCRTLRQFRQQRWISTDDRSVTIEDEAALQELAEPVGISHGELA